MRTTAKRVPVSFRISAVAALALAAGQALAQCGNPALFEFGGVPGPVCTGGLGTQADVEAVARGRFVSFENVPLISGGPSVLGRVALDHPATFMTTEIVGRVWATDGQTIYGIDASNPASPQILGRITVPNGFGFARMRIKGNFVYATDNLKLYIVDVTNPGAPVLRSTFDPTPFAFLNDVEVVGSFAYLPISESPSVNSLMVLDISNPAAPVELRRVGNSNREGYRVSKAPGLSGLYTLTRNPAGGALELWSLATPSNPSISVLNATLNGSYIFADELRATNTSIVRWDDENNQLKLYNTASLASIGPPVTFPTVYPARDFFTGFMGTDPPYAFLTQESGELTRVNPNTSPPDVSDPYLDVVPGYTEQVLTLNEGFSVLTGENDLWFYSTPSGGTPFPFAHLKADSGATFLGRHAALLSGGTLFATEEGATGAGGFTRIIAYHVIGGASPGVFFQGSLDIAGGILGLDAGVDANGARVYFTTGSTSSATLHVVNAQNLGAMSQMSTFELTSGVYSPVRFLPATLFPPRPERVLVGGQVGVGKPQIVSVAAAGSPSSLGVIPSSSKAIAGGLPPTVWLLDENVLKAYDISTPATPVPQSTTVIGADRYNDEGVALRVLGIFGSPVGVTTFAGDLVKVNVPTPSAPVIAQIAKINSTALFSGANDLATDGTNLHVANGVDGYTILPFSFDAPPREDPNHSLRLQGTQSIVGICPGTALQLTASFVAIPAVTAYQWQRYNRATFVYDTLPNGPTGTGSTVSGATTATVMISNPGAADATYYRCQATNPCGSAMTDTVVEARLGGYANCDSSTVAPVLNVLDFLCFLNQFTAAGPGGFTFDYANCDGSTDDPVLTVLDFTCFLNKFAAGCP